MLTNWETTAYPAVPTAEALNWTAVFATVLVMVEAIRLPPTAMGAATAPPTAATATLVHNSF